MSENTEQLKSSIFPEVNKKIEYPKKGQLMYPTIGVVSFLVVFFFILKKFIYIKDDTNDHGRMGK